MYIIVYRLGSTVVLRNSKPEILHLISRECIDLLVRAKRRVAGWVGNGVAGMMTNNYP